MQAGAAERRESAVDFMHADGHASCMQAACWVWLALRMRFTTYFTVVVFYL